MFDYRLAALEEKANAVRLVFANGATAEANIVIGGDGIRSKVPHHQRGEAPRRFVAARSPGERFFRQSILAVSRSPTARNGGGRTATSCPIS
jgi:hypothetical protein